MITINEAKKKAEEARKASVNKCEEYSDAYIFSHTEDEMNDGGFIAPVVILKETGEVYNMVKYITHTDNTPDDIIKTFEV